MPQRPFGDESKVPNQYIVFVKVLAVAVFPETAGPHVQRSRSDLPGERGSGNVWAEAPHAVVEIVRFARFAQTDYPLRTISLEWFVVELPKANGIRERKEASNAELQTSERRKNIEEKSKAPGAKPAPGMPGPRRTTLPVTFRRVHSPRK
jgi:hypothetical protein